ncbi:MAG: 4Fe-4S binding protein [Bacteroidia bacterium]
MAFLITEDCINCGACEPECPNNAIYEGGSKWSFNEGTKLSGIIHLPNGSEVNATDTHEPLLENLYFVVPDKCTECTGFHEEPQCAKVCPVDCCIVDPERVEPKEALLTKKSWLHAE